MSFSEENQESEEYARFRLWYTAGLFVVIAISIVAANITSIRVDHIVFLTVVLLIATLLFSSLYGSARVTSRMIKKCGLEVEGNPAIRQAYESGKWTKVYCRYVLVVGMFVLLTVVDLTSESVNILDLMPLLYVALIGLWNFLREVKIEADS